MDFPIGDSGQVIRLSPAVLDKLMRHRQRFLWQAEAGGQLFARLKGQLIEIVEATGPRATDRRGRYHYHPDKRAEQREIEERFQLGLQFVGDWHTHAQVWPEPSGTDLASMASMVRLSAHDLNGFILIVMGTAAPPGGLYLAAHDGQAAYQLQPSVQSIPGQTHLSD